jgi:hypothetical protein
MSVHSRELWNCCYGVEKYVITFDNGEQHAVCASCARYFQGPVRPLTAADSLLPPRPFCHVCERPEGPCHECTDAAGLPITVSVSAERAVIDTRHADVAYARQSADESGTAESGTAESGTAATVSYARQVADGNADFTASHDAYMREAYRDPWDVQPTNCPATGDPLTGVYGRTYAEDGWLLMQAAGDMFGPATGHTPILLFAITSASGAPLAHSPMGGARLTHIDTIDTWHGALAAMRWHINQASAVAAVNYLD